MDSSEESLPRRVVQNFVGKGEWKVKHMLDEHFSPVSDNRGALDCIIWPHGTDGGGHPAMKFRGSYVIQVRRLIYGWEKKGFPSLPWKGGHLTTTCGNKLCINPLHTCEQEVKS